MSSSKKEGGLKSFEPTYKLSPKGFIYKTWDNRIYPPFYNPDLIQELKNTWDTDENDIFICTHQKVGTHLTKKFACEILRNAIDYPNINGIQKGDIGHHTIPWPEVMASQHGIDHFKAHLENTKGYPRLWYTHCSMYDLPFRSLHKKTRFIHVFRDPRGTFISQYYFYRSHPMLGVSEDVSIDEFLNLFINGALYFGDYHTHTLEWIHGCGGKIEKENLLVLRYEDLVMRKFESMNLLARFLLAKNPFSEEKMKNIIASTEFENMKHEMTVNPQSFHFNPQTFFRAGKTDDWVEKLNSDQIMRIDTKTKSKWGEKNLSFPDLIGINTL